MKKLLLYVCLLLTCCQAWGQINVVPFVGLNTTKLNYRGSFEKGGSFGLAGLELEYKIKLKKSKRILFSATSGISYLKNGFFNSSSFAYTALDLYSQDITDLQTEYVQVPLVLRIHWQPFPLVEEWKLFFGAGVSSSFLMNSTLHEKNTFVIYNTDLLAPPVTTQYEDRGNITDLGNSQSLFRRFEIGMNYKKIMIAFRLSKSLEDMRHARLEKSWGVPAEKSGYISTYKDYGKISEKYSELVLGFRVGK